MMALRCTAFRVDAQRLLRRPHNSPLRRSRKQSTQQKPPEPPLLAQPPVVEIPLVPKEPIDIPSSLWYHRLGPVTDFFVWFNRMQQRRPLTVQLYTSLTTYLCGDLLAQEIGGEKYDPKRTLRMLFIGSVGSIPGYKWFMYLGNHFNYSSRLLSITTKVTIQQIFFTPIFNTYFFGMQAILTGMSPSGVIHRVRQTVPESIINSAKFWPMITAFSFTVIPAQYRFMFSGVFAVVWQTYLSFLNRREEKNILEAAVALPVVQAVEVLAQEEHS